MDAARQREREARAKVIKAAQAQLYGVEMPKKIDFKSKTLYNDYQMFKTLTQRILKYYDGLEEKWQVDMVLLWMGPDAVMKHTRHPFTDGEQEEMEPLWTFFDSICIKQDGTEGSWNAARMRLKFMKQGDKEAVDVFYGRIRDVLNQCEYPDAASRLMEAETLKYGLSNTRVLEKVYALRKDATTEQILEATRAEEDAQRHMREVEKIKKDHHLTETRSTEELRKGQKNRYGRKGKPQQKDSKPYNCSRCGRNHAPRKCPAFGKTCAKCKRTGHFADVCRAKDVADYKPSGKSERKSGGKHRRRFHEAAAEDGSDDDFSDYDTEEVTVEETRKKFFKKQKQITFDDDDDSKDTHFGIVQVIRADGTCKRLRGKVDTGAQVNLLNYTTFKELYGEDADKMLRPSTVKLTGYGGRQFKNHGSFRAPKIIHNNHIGRRVEFYVTDYGSNLFSLKFSRRMGMIIIPCEQDLGCTDCQGDYDVNEISGQDGKKKYKLEVRNPIEVHDTKQVIAAAKDIFTGVGKLKGYKYHIEMDETVCPVVDPREKSSVPEKLKPLLKEKLDKMEEDGIIRKQPNATRWVSSVLVTPKKNGDLRICLNPKPLNRAVKRPHHYPPTLDEILPKLAGCKYFSSLDQSSGYWNVQVDEESQELLTFNTPFGRYSFKRLPFGLNSSQDVFQRAVDETFGSIPNVYCIADDILIAAKTRQEHDTAVNRILQKCRESGFRLNPDKAKILAVELPFFGHILTPEGLKPDPRKLDGIKCLQEPKSKQELQSILGCFTYLGRYIKNLSAKTQELRNLVKQSADFEWTEHHTKILKQLKECITADQELAYFDPKKQIIIECDASMKGLGACLIQEGKPVDFSSRSLTDAESRYSNIDREMLAVTWSILHYRKLLFGQQFIVRMDHSPLVQIMKKDVKDLTPKIQRMVRRIQGYNAILEYKKGKEMLIADCLSRCIPPASPHQKPVFEDTINIGIFEVNNAGERDLHKVRTETRKDPALQVVEEYIRIGWPQHRNQVPDVAHSYWDHRHDLACIDGLILKGHSIIIPQPMRETLLKKLHRVHQGSEKTIQRARSKWYWPGITEQIRRMVRDCDSCQEHQVRQKQLPAIPVLTNAPMEKLGVDVFTYRGKTYQMIVDYHTGYPWVKQLKTQKAEELIAHLQDTCDMFGYPTEIVSDRGSQYMSEDFKGFCQAFNIDHLPGSAHSQWKNGRCERTIGTFENLMEKSKGEDVDMRDIVIALRDTPLSSDIPSPYELMFSRSIKSDLPALPLQFYQSAASGKAGIRSQEHAEYKNQLDRRQEKPALYEDQPVYYLRAPQDRKPTWSSGKVTSVDGARGYTVCDDKTNAEYSRDRCHIRPIPKPNPNPTSSAEGRKEPVPKTPKPAKPASKPAAVVPDQATAKPAVKPAAESKGQAAKTVTPPTVRTRPKRHVKAPDWYGDRTTVK